MKVLFNSFHLNGHTLVLSTDFKATYAEMILGLK